MEQTKTPSKRGRKPKNAPAPELSPASSSLSNLSSRDESGKLQLPTVTLIQIATGGATPEVVNATAQCMDLSQFGAVCFLGAKDLPHVTDYESYNRFVVRELHKYFETDHCLLIQSDGFILRPEAWDPAFLGFDYVGAPFGDGVVGNGGFSLRSRKFCQATAAESDLLEQGMGGTVEHSPEDQILCRGIVRAALEDKGMRFADTETASRFSWELHDNWPEYNSSFGFHGLHTLERLTALKAQGKLGEFAEIPIPPNKWSA